MYATVIQHPDSKARVTKEGYFGEFSLCWGILYKADLNFTKQSVSCVFDVGKTFSPACILRPAYTIQDFLQSLYGHDPAMKGLGNHAAFCMQDFACKMCTYMLQNEGFLAMYCTQDIAR